MTSSTYHRDTTPAPTDRVPPERVRRVLVTKLRHHGDVLLATPVITVLKRAFPDAEIDALVYAETAAMIAGHPSLTKLFTIDRNWKRSGIVVQVREELRLLRAMRARGHDLLVHLTEHPRGLVLALLLRPRWSVTRARRPDEHPRLWKEAFTHFYSLPQGRSRHTVETNLDALRRIGISPQSADKRLVIVPDDAARRRIDALLVTHRLVAGRFAQLHPGSRWLFKTWPAARAALLVEKLVAGGLDVVITGAPDAREREIVAELLAALTPVVRANVRDVTGQLSLVELAALTQRARIFIGVDSAPMHIAAAVGTPAVALFGPSDEIEWRPWQVAHRVVVSREFPCRPCRNDGCGGGKASECLTTLGVEPVAAAVDALLEETAATPT
ncbi:MAG TPA: putative lipopolysaccharide heptosyltransferase III [Casimicrobiaceae bacterium]|nr:putative lipopolysaccharide heptosyltransferase III [Casimicrobiaceae bacterium]